MGGGYGYNGNVSDHRGSGGGGATDVRINGTNLNNRIIVAGAGSGGVYFTGYGTNYPGYGGGTIGGNGYTSSYDASCNYSGKGGSQTAGGAGGKNTTTGRDGTLGQGGSSGGTDEYASGGGGGGYYGGGSSSAGMAGGGGSGYIGGVTSGQTIAGNESMPSPSGSTETGHTGNGYAKITLIN